MTNRKQIKQLNEMLSKNISKEAKEKIEKKLQELEK